MIKKHIQTKVQENEQDRLYDYKTCFISFYQHQEKILDVVADSL